MGIYVLFYGELYLYLYEHSECVTLGFSTYVSERYGESEQARVLMKKEH
jgi:hypothetical protein